MAESSSVKTYKWDDPWHFDLTITEKVVWDFLLTNSERTLGGVYRLPLSRIHYYFQAEMTKDEVFAVLGRFMAEGKILYKDEWVVMRNHFKHQNFGGPKQWGAVATAINKAPLWLRERLLSSTDRLSLGIDTVSNGYLYLDDTEPTKAKIKVKVSKDTLNLQNSANGAVASGRAVATAESGAASRETVPPKRKLTPDEYLRKMDEEGRL